MSLHTGVLFALYAWPEERNLTESTRVYLRSAKLLYRGDLTPAGRALKKHIMALPFDDEAGLREALNLVWSQHPSSERTRHVWRAMTSYYGDEDFVGVVSDTALMDELCYSLEGRTWSLMNWGS
jgi:hypothetical protein